MPKGTKSITEAVERVTDLRAALAEVLKQVAEEKAAATKAAAEKPKT